MKPRRQEAFRTKQDAKGFAWYIVSKIQNFPGAQNFDSFIALTTVALPVSLERKGQVFENGSFASKKVSLVYDLTLVLCNKFYDSLIHMIQVIQLFLELTAGFRSFNCWCHLKVKGHWWLRCNVQSNSSGKCGWTDLSKRQVDVSGDKLCQHSYMPNAPSCLLIRRKRLGNYHRNVPKTSL